MAVGPMNSFPSSFVETANLQDSPSTFVISQHAALRRFEIPVKQVEQRRCRETEKTIVSENYGVQQRCI
jgi:hypothetical protein